MQYQINSAICKIYEKKNQQKPLRFGHADKFFLSLIFDKSGREGWGEKSFSSWQISKVSTFLQLEIVSLFAEVRNVAMLLLGLYNYLRECQLGQFMPTCL